MPTVLSILLRGLLPALAVFALSACTHFDVKRLAGDYVAGGRRLTLTPTGEFDYDGGGCFPAHSNSDVGFLDAFGGHYRVEGRWILLEPAEMGYIEGCSAITLKLYALEVEGHRYLFDERSLRGIAHAVRLGVPPDRFHTWHVSGQPAEFSDVASDWLPAPYAQWATMPPPAGHVIAIGPVERRFIYGSAGRIDGEEIFAMLTVDFGQRDGAFAGMPVCVPDRPGRFWLETAGNDTSTLRWSWSPTGEGAPVPGMPLGSACR